MLTSINRRMPLIYSLVGMLFVAVAGLFLYSGIRGNVDKNRARLLNHATLVTAAIDPAQLDRIAGDGPEKEAAIREFSSVVNNLVAVSSEFTGISVARSDSEGVEVLIGSKEMFEGLLSESVDRKATLIDSLDAGNSSSLTAYVPAKSGNGDYVIAVAMHGYDAGSVSGGFKAVAVPMFLIAGASIMMALCLLSRRYQNRVKDFIQEWIESEYQLQNEELAEKEDELVLLRKTFSRMKEDLQKANAEREALEFKLENSGDELEQRVVARTRELLESIRDLNNELEERREIEKKRLAEIKELKEKTGKLKTLSGLLPICASCKKIRDEDGRWNELEAYIEAHSDIIFSHGICPDCIEKLYPVKQAVKSPMRGVPYLR